MSLRLPSNWHTLSPHQRLCYIVNTRQAANFVAAGRMLAARKKVAPRVSQETVVQRMEQQKLF